MDIFTANTAPNPPSSWRRAHPVACRRERLRRAPAASACDERREATSMIILGVATPQKKRLRFEATAPA